MKNYSSLPPERIAATFTAFSKDETVLASPLYTKLAHNIAQEEELLAIAAHSRYGQPMPNCLLAAVHYLLLENPAQPLAFYYPSITGKPVEVIPIKIFKDFCLANGEAIIQLLSSRLVQTNVISRCSYMAPVFSKIIADHAGQNVTMIDIGTSAGLTLNWDKYEYHYSNGLTTGSSDAKVYCEIRGGDLAAFTIPDQQIRKIGLDQNLIDPTDTNDARWLRALVWPDQPERFAAMDAALKIKDLKNIEFIKASAVSDFREIILSVPANELLIVYCTHALYQFPEEMRINFWQMLDKASAERDFYFLSAEDIPAQREKYDTQNTVVELTTYQKRNKTQKLIAEVNSHGKWIIWRA